MGGRRGSRAVVRLTGLASLLLEAVNWGAEGGVLSAQPGFPLLGCSPPRRARARLLVQSGLGRLCGCAALRTWPRPRAA